MCNEGRLQGNVMLFATFQITDFSKVFLLFEFGHSSANARDTVAAGTDTVCGPDCAAQHTACSYDVTFMVVMVALYLPPPNPWIVTGSMLETIVFEATRCDEVTGESIPSHSP